ncbi:MAG TPA: hypothetical protein VFZ09_01190 [Archangium sp.]|uniref:hypothetical protein n=1 Tax=Archangium sp. TaxID=1872627 RepID=UPI002E348D83|nr:hypothetical protein [Archangium sp.]HEX5744823.1 hypothetical protein [Archangium sp.]
MLNRIRAALAQLLMPRPPAFDPSDVGEEADEAAYHRGEAYCFEHVEFARGSAGIIDGPAPIVVMLDQLRGIAMTRTSAINLVGELLDCLDAPAAALPSDTRQS